MHSKFERYPCCDYRNGRLNLENNQLGTHPLLLALERAATASSTIGDRQKKWYTFSL